MGKGTALGVLGLLIGAGGLGFGIYIFLTFGAQIADLEGDGGIECDSGRILETQKVESTVNDDIWDFDTTITQMKNMNISITTHGESYLAMRFFAYLYLYIKDESAGVSLLGRCDFNISIYFNDKSVSVASITHHHEQSPVSYDNFEVTYTKPIYLEYITASLYAGTYNIKVMWVCIYNSFENAQLATNNVAPSTLIVQEIAHCQLFAPIGF
ncbi:MAG: hypothetical protein HWN81_06695 [Candidatus Lokiarchaeota archaeon]|nr:hypothetical protein [Candidatus Lokiarchaeota archaeon]